MELKICYLHEVNGSKAGSECHHRSFTYNLETYGSNVVCDHQCWLDWHKFTSVFCIILVQVKIYGAIFLLFHCIFSTSFLSFL